MSWCFGESFLSIFANVRQYFYNCIKSVSFVFQVPKCRSSLDLVNVLSYQGHTLVFQVVSVVEEGQLEEVHAVLNVQRFEQNFLTPGPKRLKEEILATNEGPQEFFQDGGAIILCFQGDVGTV